MILVCHVVLQGHVIKMSCDFIDTSPTKVTYHAAKFGSHRHFGCGKKCF